MKDVFDESGLSSCYDQDRLSAAARFWPVIAQGVPAWPTVGAGQRAIILGGGVAGLCAAYSLRQAGFAPIVLESAGRAGGRFLTCRDTFDGQYAELGVTRIPESHALTLAYVRHFGLPLVAYPKVDTRQLYVVDGLGFKSGFQAASEYPKELSLTENEALCDAESLHHIYTAALLAKIGSPADPGWPSPLLRSQLGNRTFYECLASHGASHAAREICRAYDGTEIDVFDAIGWLANMRRDTSGAVSLAIPGGNDQLTTAFAHALGECVQTSAQVKWVRRSGHGVTVGYTRNGRSEQIDGDVVVCAVPHRVLADLDFDPPLTSAKLAAVLAVPTLAVVRLNFQFSRRFWNLDEGLRGLLVACTTSPIERLWDLSLLQPGERGILSAYVQHRNAALLDELPTDQARIEYGLSILSTFLPAAREYFLRGSCHSWQKSSGGGGWAVYLPGQLDLLQSLQRAEGRIHFAGDHTSLYVGWVQGAIESAHCAVAEIIARRVTE